jgi:hypothetical protein
MIGCYTRAGRRGMLAPYRQTDEVVRPAGNAAGITAEVAAEPLPPATRYEQVARPPRCQTAMRNTELVARMAS